MTARPRFLLFDAGHRPFFLAALLLPLMMMPWWLAVHAGLATPPGRLGGVLWHGHEMLHGYATAVLAGFLLIGTGGRPLVVLACLWLAGRVAMAMAGPLPVFAVAVVDLAFLPALALMRRPVLWRARRLPAVLFLPLLAALTAARTLIHLDAAGLVPGGAWLGLQFAFDLFTLLLVVLAGRLAPAYARAEIRSLPRDRDDLHERLALLFMLVTLVTGSIGAPAELRGTAFALLAVVLFDRQRRWRPLATLARAHLCVLQAGHAWLIVGAALRAAGAYGWLPVHGLDTHALGLGALATLTLGMMVRITRQHAGRDLAVGRVVAMAFAAVNLAAALRVLVPLAWPHLAVTMLLPAAIAWCLALAATLTVLAPMLIAGSRRD